MAAVTPYYATTRTLDAGKGDVVMTGANWLPGAPMLEVAKRVLRTPKGSYLPDPTFGVDYSGITHATSGSGAALQAAIVSAFSFYVKRGYITSLTVSVTQAGTALQYDVSFYDPRARVRVVVPTQRR